MDYRLLGNNTGKFFFGGLLMPRTPGQNSLFLVPMQSIAMDLGGSAAQAQPERYYMLLKAIMRIARPPKFTLAGLPILLAVKSFRKAESKFRK
jgi:hypothetical protein